jgi:hypothetical protein
LLELDVSMQTLNTDEVVASPALLDCGATGLFVNGNIVKMKNLMMRKLSQPVNVYNVDGTPNEAGKVSEVWETVLQYCDHSECAVFAVTCLGKQNIILGLDWLHEHNAKQKTVFKEAEYICTCHAGPMPSTDVDMEDIPDLAPDSNDNEDGDKPYVGENALEDRDRVFVATIPCKVEFI